MQASFIVNKFVVFVRIQFCRTINNEEKSYNKRYLPLSFFSKYNETSPQLVYSQETSGTVMSVKFQLISMQSAKVLNEDR